MVLVTGIGGFIAKHLTAQLLAAGHAVRGTVRSPSRAEEVRLAMQAQGLSTERLSFVTLDLERDEGWEAAVQDCRFVHHVAAPFPLVQPADREALVPAARDGALRVLKAASGAERIIMTSSIAAMMYAPRAESRFTFGPEDWSDPEWSLNTPYVVAKTRAEQAAWAYMDEVGRRQNLTAINPGLVLGPPLDAHWGTSLDVVSMLIQGKYPAVPPVAFPIVDVRDVAALHVKAMTAPVGGQRLLAAADTLSLSEMGHLLRTILPQNARRIPTQPLPLGLTRFLSLFDKSLATLKPDLGRYPVADSRQTTELTGLSLRLAAEAVKAAAMALSGKTPH
uniref:NAD-dependent epimerase/dehydratase family protein n=1 Tax=Asticcacaulis sp. TaxID=1872648 RepID=UPI0026091E5F|nr:NAD-dependent epimerase/dehydratase family protein [Asticcacaulis sp.]